MHPPTIYPGRLTRCGISLPEGGSRPCIERVREALADQGWR